MGPWGDREVLARRLFAGLRELDKAGTSVIACPLPQMGGKGEANTRSVGEVPREQ